MTEFEDSGMLPIEARPTDWLPTDDRRARMVLSRVAEPGHETLRELVAEHGAVAALRWIVGGVGKAPTGLFPERVSAALLADDIGHTERVRARVLIPSDPEWPVHVEDLACPPLCLWVWGGQSIDLAAVTANSVAIVGARSSTAYGSQVAADLAVGLSEREYAVISGAAFGIDAAAHRGALAAGGTTIAVLAGGIDRLYPASHASLLRQISEQGAVITEQPPGVAPIGSRFLLRNRIIAALALGTVVVEASLRSGSLNTARHADTLARHVAAVPGPVTSMQSAGCHELIRAHRATLVTDVAEIVDLVGRIGADLAPQKRGETRPLDALDPADRPVYESLPIRRFASVERIASAVGQSDLTVRAALGRLHSEGLAATDGLDGWRKAVTSTQGGKG